MVRSLECKIYQDELRKLGKGVPLYEPNPSTEYHIHIGDVGYLHDGRFRSCFNVFQNSTDTMGFNSRNRLPDTFMPIALDFTVVEERTRSAAGSVFMTESVESANGDLGLDVWSDIPSIGFHLFVSQESERGALLSIRSSATHSVAVMTGAIEGYFLEHYECWFTFLQSQGHSLRKQDIMLVTECHLTGDWATGVWTERFCGGGAGFTLVNRLVASFSGERRTSISIPPRYGPDPDRILAGGAEPAPEEAIRRDQCIFVRCFWVKDRVPFPPKLKASAGPHKLDVHQDQGEGPKVLSSDVWPGGEEQPEDIEPHEFALDLILERTNAQVAVVHETDVFALAEALGNRFVKPVNLEELRWKGKHIEVVSNYHEPSGKIVGALKHADSFQRDQHHTTATSLTAQVTHPKGTMRATGKIGNILGTGVPQNPEEPTDSVLIQEHLPELPVEIEAREGVASFSPGCIIVGHLQTEKGGKRCYVYCTGSKITTEMREVPKIVSKMAQLWSKMNHPNILPILGVHTNNDDLGIVFDYAEYSSALDYVLAHPEADPLSLSTGIAEGLAYIHAQNIIHDDIKSWNIFVTENGTPRIRAPEQALHAAAPNVTIGTRWMAPERLKDLEKHGEGNLPTQKSDVWSFGMTGYELLTKKIPYERLPNIQVVLAIMRGEQPTLPSEYDSWPKGWKALWKICEDCWGLEPANRPSMDEIVTRLKALQGIGTAGLEKGDGPSKARE